MSSYPSRNDVLPDVSEPQKLLCLAADAVEALESQAAGTCLSGGDVPAYGTAPAGRRVTCLLTRDFAVPAASNGQRGLTVRLDSLLSEAPFLRCPVSVAPAADRPGPARPLSLQTVDPLMARCARNVRRTSLSCALSPGADGGCLVSICTPDTEPRLQTGEVLSFSLLLYAGVAQGVPA